MDGRRMFPVRRFPSCWGQPGKGRMRLILGIAHGVTVGLLAATATAQPLDLQTILDRGRPAVVIVRASSDGGVTSGTGFFISQEGLALTAAHVARGRERIVLERGGARLPAHLVGYDARRDVALLRADASGGLPTLELADSTSVRTGDPVVVIGSPRGRPITWTAGQVLGVGATLPGLVPGILIRHDAPIVPGHSGSPLLNAQAQVIGLVIAISHEPGEEGGLAVASSVIRAILPQLVGGARLERAWIGIAGMTVDPELSRRRRLSVTRGVLVLDVVPGSPAEAAGIRPDRQDGPSGDVIVSADGREIARWEDLLRVLGEREPGQRLRLGVVREGTLVSVELVLGARP